MKLKLISEVQYKNNSSSLDRSQSPGVLAQDSVNDYYNKKDSNNEESESESESESED